MLGLEREPSSYYGTRYDVMAMNRFGRKDGLEIGFSAKVRGF
jgi:hypothetical protein